ncbi:hypothetical protein AB0C02_32230 [Micromonospora sp. NPDC048999]|uniref:hypothetical protein n=1 Tax=Micromonospora sp. NPDC048999 TaxID=3155391 RepID=UPI0033E0306F
MDKIHNLGGVRLVDAVANEPQVIVRLGNDERRKFASDDGVHDDRRSVTWEPTTPEVRQTHIEQYVPIAWLCRDRRLSAWESG